MCDRLTASSFPQPRVMSSERLVASHLQSLPPQPSLPMSGPQLMENEVTTFPTPGPSGESGQGSR